MYTLVPLSVYLTACNILAMACLWTGNPWSFVSASLFAPVPLSNSIFFAICPVLCFCFQLSKINFSNRCVWKFFYKTIFYRDHV